MKYSVVVLGGPHSSQCAVTALNFVKALIRADHQVYRVFFYHDGVYNGNSLNVTPQDELDIPDSWKTLQQDHDLDLVVCIAAAVKRGILDVTESERHEKNHVSLHAGFELSGLGQLADAVENSDRLITFAS